MKLRCKKTNTTVDRLIINGIPQDRWLCAKCRRYHTRDELK